MAKKRIESRTDSLGGGHIGVKQVATSKLKPNPHNPRSLFDSLPLKTLLESIEKVGILVPLTVYWSSSEQSYVILDGQRRWICAVKLKLRSVPVNQVAEPDLIQNIVTMFQIHKLREDWELMPTALSLQVLMKALEEKNDSKLAGLTGLDQAVVKRCKKLLDYPKKYQDMMMEPDPDMRVKADFFIELHPVRNDRLIQRQSWYEKNDFTERMLVKYKSKKSGFRSVTDFRRIKQYINNAVKAKKESLIATKLKEFTFQPEVTIDHLEIAQASIASKARDMVKQVEHMASLIDAISVSDFYGEEELWNALERLNKQILKVLESADRRRSK